MVTQELCGNLSLLLLLLLLLRVLSALYTDWHARLLCTGQNFGCPPHATKCPPAHPAQVVPVHLHYLAIAVALPGRACKKIINYWPSGSSDDEACTGPPKSN